VKVEERWEPNPNYSPQAAEEHGELPYRLHTETVYIWPRYWMLRALWEKGLLTNEYAETHLSDLIDLACRNAQNFTLTFSPLKPIETESPPEETESPQT
jgi:hypothetical protein